MNTFQAIVKKLFKQKKSKSTHTHITETPLIDRSLLTPKEIEVLDLMLDGKTYKEISKLLNIAIGTARKHGSNILKKTEFKSRKFLDKKNTIKYKKQ